MVCTEVTTNEAALMRQKKIICYDWLACPLPACSHRLSASTPWMDVLVGMRQVRPMQVLKKKATEEKQKLVDTCVAHSFLHLYLLIGKIKAIDC